MVKPSNLDKASLEEKITVHYQTNPGTQPRTLTGVVQVRYSVDKIVVEREGDLAKIVVDENEGVYHLNGGKELGRYVCFEKQ